MHLLVYECVLKLVRKLLGVENKALVWMCEWSMMYKALWVLQ